MTSRDELHAKLVALTEGEQGKIVAEYIQVREALAQALGGWDAMPENITALGMVEALRQTITFLRKGWANTGRRRDAAWRALADAGIDRPQVADALPPPQPMHTGMEVPAIRWCPDGEHAGYYVYLPFWQKWRRFGVDGAGEPLALEPVEELPPDTELLYCWADVRLALAAYSYRIGEVTEAKVTDEVHETVVAEIYGEALDGQDWPETAADIKYEQQRESQCARGTVAGLCGRPAEVMWRGKRYCRRCAEMLEQNARVRDREERPDTL